MIWQAYTLVAAILAADPTSAAVQKDLQALQGAWTVVSMEMDGKFMSDERRKKIKLTIDGEKFTFDSGSDTHHGLYKIDPSKQPAELNIEVQSGDETGKVYLVIYKFAEGRMVQCMRLDNKTRPSEFTGKAGSGNLLEIWEKQK